MKYEYIMYLIVLFTNDRILIFLFDSKSPSINEAAWHWGNETIKRPNGLYINIDINGYWIIRIRDSLTLSILYDE
jgi:hypothetical protein